MSPRCFQLNRSVDRRAHSPCQETAARETQTNESPLQGDLNGVTDQRRALSLYWKRQTDDGKDHNMNDETQRELRLKEALASHLLTSKPLSTNVRRL